MEASEDQEEAPQAAPRSRRATKGSAPPDDPAPAREAPEAFVDPIEPARGKSILLDSVLAWRDPTRDTPYLSNSLVDIFHIAVELLRPTPTSSSEAPAASAVIDAQTLLKATQVLGRQGKFSLWATYFQNEVLGQEVLPSGFDAVALRNLVQTVRSRSSNEASAGAILQWDVVEVLAEASKLRQRTNDDYTQIGVRHVAAAYFLTPAGQAALRDQGLLADYEALRGRMVRAMSARSGARYGDDDEAWRLVVQRVGAASLEVRLKTTETRSAYAADVVNLDETDLLGAERDAKALADVILLRGARPPMALGIFGPWGSGKSTLMRRLQSEIHEQLTAERAVAPERRDLSELGRVGAAIQIEFSAWSFADSENLWAALTAEVFDQIAAGGLDKWRDKPRADLVGAIAKRLSSEAVAFNTAAAQASEHELEARRLRTALSAAQKQKDWAGIDAVRKVLGDFLVSAEPKPKSDGDDKKDDEAKGADEKNAPPENFWGRLREAFLDAPTVGDAKGAAGNLKALGAVGDAARKMTWKSMAGVYSWGLVVMAVAFFGLAGWAILAERPPIGSAPPWVLGALGAASLTAPYVLSALRLFSRFLEERAKRRTAALVEESEAKVALAKVEDDLAQARSRADNSRAIADALGGASNAPAAPGLMLNYLLRESEDLAQVRKQIGMINKVRRCFEQLAAVIREMVESQAPDAVERIIVYIDDLDRCNAKQVVAILEAIHLLLAFDCFVVVVAVDPKWLAQSLNDQHDQLAGGRPSPGRASAEDYLEKIFQLALQVRPLVDPAPAAKSRYGAYQEFAGGILEPKPDKSAKQVDAPLDTPSKANPSLSSEGTAVSPLDPTQRFAIAGPERPADFDAVRRERVTLGPDETKLLLALGPLAAKSPRAVKRMINVYRLIRVGQADDLDGFLAKGADPGPKYWAVLLALACEIGLPPALMAQLSRVAQRASDEQWSLLMEASSGVLPSNVLSKLPASLRKLQEDFAAAGLDAAFARAWGDVAMHLGREPQREEFLAGLAVVSRYSLRSLDAA